MRHNASNGDSGATHSRQALRDRQQRAIAQDMSKRGGNPVTVSDVRQDASTRQSPGAAILSKLLH